MIEIKRRSRQALEKLSKIIKNSLDKNSLELNGPELLLLEKPNSVSTRRKTMGGMTTSKSMSKPMILQNNDLESIIETSVYKNPYVGVLNQTTQQTEDKASTRGDIKESSPSVDSKQQKYE